MWNKFSTQFYKTKESDHRQKVNLSQNQSPMQLRGENPPLVMGPVVDCFFPNLNLTLKS